MSRVLISGVAGFVGSTLCERLIDFFEVIGIDNLSNGTLSNLHTLLNNQNMKFFKKDVRHIRCDEIPKSIKVLYHLAVNNISNYSSYTENIEMTKKMLEIARKKDVEKFVFVSSTKCMGLVTSKKPLDELVPCKPHDLYGRSKLECEKLVKNFCERYGIKYYIFRPPRIFGPRDWQRTFINLSTLILKTGIVPLSPIKVNVIYVKNLVEALYLVSRKNVETGVYIVSDGAYSISEVGITISKILGKEKIRKLRLPKIIFSSYSLLTGSFTHARRGITYSSRKFRREFNFTGSYSLYDGLKETLIYFGIIKNDEGHL